MFSDAILEMGIDPIKGELLVMGVAGFAKKAVSKLAVVAMVVLNLHAVLGGKALESSFCVDRFF